MSVKELSIPIRIYWDLAPSDEGRTSLFQRIAGEVFDAGILSLNLFQQGPQLGRACLAVMEALKNKPLAFSLTLPAAALNKQVSELFRNSGIRTLFIQTASMTDLAAVEKLLNNTGSPEPPGISFEVTGNNYRDLPEVISWCLKNGIHQCVLPMQRLENEGNVFYLTSRQQQALAEELKMITIPDSFRTTIHDPFLWKAFHHDQPFPGSGCQAANTLLYISPGLDVYPCPTMPVRMGNLEQQPLMEIILSDGKKELRKRLLTSPETCRACSALDSCRGGCRGRTYVLKQSLIQQDPACAE
jgi:GeoRSP system SPASM domain protein